MKLPANDASWDDVARIVADELAALDDRKRLSTWRYRAVGMTKAQAIADAPRHSRLEVNLPVGEFRILRDVCAARDIGVRSYLRRSLATVMVAIDGVEPDAIPTIARQGPLLP